MRLTALFGETVLGPLLVGLVVPMLAIGCQSTADESRDTAPSTMVLELGQYDVTTLITDSFVTLHDGDDAKVEYGGQGSLMCVIGARVLRPITSESVFTVEAALRRPDGQPWARPKLRVRPVAAPDGWSYVPGLYLIIANDAFDRSWEGAIATLEVTITDTKNPDVPAQSASFSVRLVAQTGVNAPPSLIPDAGSWPDDAASPEGDVAFGGGLGADDTDDTTAEPIALDTDGPTLPAPDVPPERNR